jgi:methyl-accepting chemotaxis protein
MAASSAEVSQAIENIASVSEENSAAIEEASAAAEEMSAQVQKAGAAAHSLVGLAGSLKEVVAQFKIERGEGERERKGVGGTDVSTTIDLSTLPAADRLLGKHPQSHERGSVVRR